MNPETTPKVVTVNESDLQCLICLDVLFQPYTLSACGHTFCGLCLQEKDLKIGFRHSTSVLCPHCRTNLGCVPSLFKNIQLSQLCESAYWILPENNDKRREKQAQYDKRRAEIKRETELSNRKRSFTEFKAELNKLISYRGDIIDPESAKKMRTFVDEEMRMLPIEGPVPPLVSPAPIVDQGSPYTDEQVRSINTALKTKLPGLIRVQSSWYVNGFMHEIMHHVHQLEGTVGRLLFEQRVPPLVLTNDHERTQNNLGRSAACAWLSVHFPFVGIAPVATDLHSLSQMAIDTESRHRRRITASSSAEVKAPISRVQMSWLAREIQSTWDMDRHTRTNQYFEAYLNEIESKVPQVFELLSNDICSFVPGPFTGSQTLLDQSHQLGRTAAEYVLSKYLPRSRTQQQPA